MTPHGRRSATRYAGFQTGRVNLDADERAAFRATLRRLYDAAG